jgi:mRNA-degrading endonuclease toxin of MazEF toxin-antitoxin module
MKRGTLVTLDLSGGVGAEKQGCRPAVVVNEFKPTVLAVPITRAEVSTPDSSLSRQRYIAWDNEGLTRTCEQAISVDPSRIMPREGAGALGPSEIAGIVKALDVAAGLAPTRPEGCPHLRDSRRARVRVRQRRTDDSRPSQ